MEFYPRRSATNPSQLYVPEAIQEIATQVVESLNVKSAKLDSRRLVRTYESPVPPAPVPHELQDLLQLNNKEHVFYI